MRNTPKIAMPRLRWKPAGGSSARPSRKFSNVSIIQPVIAIQPTTGMTRISAWTTIRSNQRGPRNGHTKASPTLFIGRAHPLAVRALRAGVDSTAHASARDLLLEHADRLSHTVAEGGADDADSV